MPPKTLSDMEAAIDLTAFERLGHDIAYRSGATGPFRTIRVQGTYEDGEVAPGISTMIEQQIELTIPKAAIPDEPTGSDRIRTPKVVGVTFKPVNVRTDATGRNWLVNLQKANV